eukprot:Amastigsp_a182450_70.p3 type:complete len:111 gc:universal Amastigsp_a182450_70:345-13(-)
MRARRCCPSEECGALPQCPQWLCLPRRRDESASLPAPSGDNGSWRPVRRRRATQADASGLAGSEPARRTQCRKPAQASQIVASAHLANEITVARHRFGECGRTSPDLRTQ